MFSQVHFPHRLFLTQFFLRKSHFNTFLAYLLWGSVLSDKPEEETYSVIFSSLKHPVRRRILRLLEDGSRTFTDILEQVDVDGSHLSYHLDSLKELIKKENGKYVLSDFGRAATSLMSRVEEPEKKGSDLKKSVGRIRPKPLFAFMTAVLIVSIAGGIYLQTVNTQVSSTFAQTRYRFAEQVSASLTSLSGIYISDGWGPPLTFWTRRDEYSNTSFLDIGYQQIYRSSDFGHLSLQELVKLDPDNREHYEAVDELFQSFLNFTHAMNPLMVENETSKAVSFIMRLYGNIRDRPAVIGTDFLDAYIYLNRVDRYALELASEGAKALQASVKPLTEEICKGHGDLCT
jgi:hypothetical protein